MSAGSDDRQFKRGARNKICSRNIRDKKTIIKLIMTNKRILPELLTHKASLLTELDMAKSAEELREQGRARQKKFRGKLATHIAGLEAEVEPPNAAQVAPDNQASHAAR